MEIGALCLRQEEKIAVVACILYNCSCRLYLRRWRIYSLVNAGVYIHLLYVPLHLIIIMRIIIIYSCLVLLLGLTVCYAINEVINQA